MSSLSVMLSARAGKAYAAAAAAGLAYLAPVVDDGLAASEALTCAGVALAAFQLVFWTRNATAGRHEDDAP